jgi:hypothetical protein
MMKRVDYKCKSWLSGTILLSLSIAITGLFIIACSTTHSNVYRAETLKEKRIERIAIMPMIILAASKTTVAGTYTTTWVSETWTTMAMSPAEYLPAEQVYVESLSASLQGMDLVNPRLIDKKMKNQRIPTYEQAVVRVCERFDADAVLTMKIRNLNMRAGGYLEGHTGKCDGHVDLSLHDADGTVLWSVSSDVRYEKGTVLFNIIPDPAPALSDFMKYTMKEMRVHLANLSQTIK